MPQSPRKRFVHKMRRKARRHAPALLERDGPNCHWCKQLTVDRPGEPPVGDTRTVDHLKELRFGGTSDISNLVIACADCNLARDVAQRILPRPWKQDNRATLASLLIPALELVEIEYRYQPDADNQPVPARLRHPQSRYRPS